MPGNAEAAVSLQGGLKLGWLWYLFGALMLLAVAAVSLLPMPDVGVSDKLSHVATYVVVGAWFSLLAASRHALVWTIVGLMAFGIVLELLQAMTSYRFAEWGDVLANGSGILMGILFHFTPLTRVLGFVDRKLALILLR